MRSLFRPEALAGAFDGDAGRPLHSFFPSWHTVALSTGVIVVLLFTLFGFVHYNEKVRVTGILVPRDGMTDLPAPIDGAVVRVFHHEGDRVASGEPLIEVSAEALEKNARSARIKREAEIRHKFKRMQEYFRSKMRSLDERYASLRDQQASLNEDRRSLLSEHETLDTMVKLAGEQLARWRNLASRALISAQELAEHESAALDLANRVQQLKRLSNANRRELRSVTTQLKEIPTERAKLRDELAQRTNDIHQQLADIQRNSRVSLVAPVDGVVTVLNVAVGNSVEQGQTLGQIVAADSELQALLAVPDNAPGQIKVGDPVVVRVPAFPYQRYGHLTGQIIEFSGTPMSPGQLGLIGISSDAPMYRARVRLSSRRGSGEGPALKLRAGMRLDADIVLQRRKLLDWLLEPLYTARQRAMNG